MDPLCGLEGYWKVKVKKYSISFTRWRPLVDEMQLAGDAIINYVAYSVSYCVQMLICSPFQ